MAIALTYDTMQTFFPGVFDGQQAKIEALIPVALASVSEEAWGDKGLWGAANLLAHIATVSATGGGASGTLKKLKVGRIEKEFDNDMSNEDPDGLSRTSYGKEFLRCRKQIVVTPFRVGC